jgi:hypothetical protein
MHRITCQRWLPHQQLVNKGHHYKAAAKAKKHCCHAGNKTGQCDNHQIVQRSIPL